MSVRNDTGLGAGSGADPDPDSEIASDRPNANRTLDGDAAAGDAPSNGIDDEGTYRWRGEDGSELAFGTDGSFVLSAAENAETSGETAPGSAANDATNAGSTDGGTPGEGAVDFDGDLRSLAPADLASTAEWVRREEDAPGEGVKFDGDGDGVLDDRVYADGLGGLTTVESEGTMETADANGSYGFRDAEGNVFQGNADGTFIHKRADGTASWRTAEETGETTLGEDGGRVSTRTRLDGDGEAVDGPPSGLLTLPGIRDEGLMALIDEGMSDGFLSDAELTLISALAESSLG